MNDEDGQQRAAVSLFLPPTPLKKKKKKKKKSPEYISISKALCESCYMVTAKKKSTMGNPYPAFDNGFIVNEWALTLGAFERMEFISQI